MLAKPLTQKLLDKMPEMVIVQPKIDGDRIKAVPTKDGYILLSSSGALMPCLPHINEQLNKSHWMEWTLEVRPTFDGEGYIHGTPQQDIHSICSRKKNLHSNYKSIQYHIFDRIGYATQLTRTQLVEITKQSSLGKVIKLHPSYTINKKDWKDYLDKFIKEGYEGIIIRDPSALYKYGKQNCILKFKPLKEDRFLIISAIEAISKDGKPKNMLGALELQDKEGRKFHCGAGCLSHDSREVWWAYRHLPLGKYAHVKYLRLTKDNIPREPILIEIIY